MKILIGADIVPTKSNTTEFSGGEIEKLQEEIMLSVKHTGNF